MTIIIIVMGEAFASPVTYFFNGVEAPRLKESPPPVDQGMTLVDSIQAVKARETIRKTFKVGDKESKELLSLILKETKSGGFPTAQQVLAVIEIESSFRKDAESSSSVGLMQVNAGVWKLPRNRLKNAEVNVLQGIAVLKSYYRLNNGNLRSTILSYNVGPTAYKRGQYNSTYWSRFNTAVKRYS